MAEKKLSKRISNQIVFFGRRNSSAAGLQEKNRELNELSVLRYKSGDTLQLTNRQRSIYKQTDANFIRDIRKISNLKKSKLIQVLSLSESKITKQQCNQIDFRARLHSKANIVNQNTKKQFKNIQSVDQCKCGCNRGKGKFFPLTTNLQKLSILGPGVLLHFIFKKAGIIMLLIVALIYTIYGLATNLMGNQALIDQSCYKNLYCRFKSKASDENKLNNNYLQQIQSYLGIVICVLWVIGLRILKHIGKQKNKIIDKKLQSSADFTIKISNLPRGAYEQTELICYLQELWKQKLIQQQCQNNKKGNKQVMDFTNKHLSFNSIQIIYDMQFSRKIISQILGLIVKVEGYLKFQDKNCKGSKCFIDKVNKYRQTKQQLIQNFELLQDLRKRFLNDKTFRKSISSTSCLIQFKNQRDKKQILKYFGVQKVGLFTKVILTIKNFLSPKKQVLFKGKILKIERAPEPSDLLWQNCQKPESNIRKLIIFGITFLVILLSFSIIMGLQILQNFVKKNPQSFKAGLITTLLNIATSLALQITNSILWNLMTYLLNIEYNHTLTQKIVSQMNKVFFLTSINIIVLPILSNYLIQGSGFIYGNNGLAGLAFDYHISAIIAVIKGLFNTVAMIKGAAICIKFTRYYLIRFLCSAQKLNLQKGDPNVNKFYQGTQFGIAQNYIFIIVTILHAFFFCKLQPIILLIAAFSILTFFCVNKIKLLRLCKIPNITEYLVFDTAVFLLGYAPIYYGIGCIVLSYFQNRQNSTYSFTIIQPLVCIGIGIFALSNPKDIMNKILRKILCIFCLNHQSILGIDEQSIIQTQVDQSQQQSSAQSIKSQKTNKTTQQINNNRVQSYYKSSNMLSLFGFEFMLKNQQNQDVQKQLKNYCQSFFPKNFNQNQAMAYNLVDQINKAINKQ